MDERVFRTVVVAGGAGFIGSNYVRYALEKHPEWNVRVIDKLTYAGNMENLSDVLSRVEFYRGDIASSEDVRRMLHGADAIINFAAESHVDRSLLDPLPFVRTNVEGALVLLNESRKADIKRFLQVSTDEIYGDVSNTERCSLETDPLAPRSPYAASKAAAEHFAMSFASSFGLDVVITRGSNTYGPYQYPEKIIPLFITNLLQDRKIPLYGNGSAVRDYMYVEDHAAGIDVVLHRGMVGEAYNLGAREQVSGLEIARKLLKIMEKPEDYIEHVEDRPGHDYRYSVDPGKAESLGWSRKWSLEQGLVQTVKWYVENREWWMDVKQKLEYIEHEKSWYR